MSYTITLYCTDETIKTTSVYIPFVGRTYSENYGSSSLGDYDEFIVSGLDSDWSAQFTVTPASGYSFYRWVYRVGSTDADVQYSYDSTFTYTGGEDIHIRAEGTEESGGGDTPGEPESWYCTSHSTVTIEDNSVFDAYLDSYEVHRFAVKFAESGTAKFYTTGSLETLGFLTTTNPFNEEYGEPEYEPLAYEGPTGSNNNFYFSYNVKTNTTYYVWVRGWDPEVDVGDCFLHIDLQNSSPTTLKKWSWSSSNGNANASKTSAAYSAITSNGNTRNFSYLVWNDMVDKAYDLAFKSGRNYWDVDYASYEDTKMKASGDTLTAVMFNSLRNNLELDGNTLGLGYRTGIGVVSKLGRVYGEYFTTLTDYMNACIDKL